MAVTVKASQATFGGNINAIHDIALGGSPAAGDRYLILSSWKTFSITATMGPATWTEVTEFADGSVAAGNGTGSMKVAAWFNDWQSGDAATQTITYSAAPSTSCAVWYLLQKDASETWDAALFGTAAWASASSGTVAASSGTTAVKADSLIALLMGWCDDIATITRPTTAIDVASGITWNGDYVELPPGHFTTTNGLDQAADAGYRLVTTGGTVTLRGTVTSMTAAETGAMLWVHQGVSGAAPPFDRPSRNPMVQLLSH